MAALLKTPVPPKLLKGVLTGMGQVQFPPAAGAAAGPVTRGAVAERIAGKTGHPAEAVAALLDDLARLLDTAARENFSVQNLLEALAGEGVADEATLDVFSAFWKDEKRRIRGVLADGASFNGALAKTAWRVDIVTHASTEDEAGGAEINASTAIFELQFEKDAAAAAAARAGAPTEGGETVRFEMNKDELEALMAEMDNIESAIAKVSGGDQ
jgi:hypothetical protein